MRSCLLSLAFAASLLFAGAARVDARQLDTSAPDYKQLVNALFDPITDQLGLTPEQMTRIEATATAEFTRGESFLLRFKEATAQLDEEQSKETFDEDRVRALAAQAGQAMTEMTVIKLRVKAKVMALLTPEQRALVEQQLRLSRERAAPLTLN